jgi:hypothetical protein
VNPEVYPSFFRIPPYVPPLVPLMDRAVRGAVVILCAEADRDGAFKMPRAWLAAQIGTNTFRTKEAVDVLERAGIIAVLHQGSRGQATVWRFVTIAEHDAAKARRVLAA